MPRRTLVTTNQIKGYASFLCLAIGLSTTTIGCRQAVLPLTVPSSIPVLVSDPVVQKVTDHVDLTGRTAAVDSVEVRARVGGYLQTVNFKEGALVKHGDVLFQIDPRPYQAQVMQAEGTVEMNRAKLKLAQVNLQRAKKLGQTPNAISQQDLDLYAATEMQAEADLKTALGNLHTARLNLEFSKVVSPIDGRTGRYYVTVGNLIIQDQTLLTTIVSVDPIYAYCDVDEQTVLHVQRLIREGKAKSARDPNAHVPVLLGLASEEGYPHEGTINFVDNQVNPQTGTLRIRGVFSNPEGVLTPGLFVRIRVPIGEPHDAILVSDRAIDNDQGQKIVFVVNDKNEVVSRPVRTGALDDGLRVIEAGLKPGERVVVNGLQNVRAGVVVEPKQVEMPRTPAAVGSGEGPIPIVKSRNEGAS